jgi:hypothetical protein
MFYSVLRPAPVEFCFVFFSVTFLSHLSDILQCLCLLVYLSVYLMSHACLSVNVCLRLFIVYVSEIVYLSLSCICLSSANMSCLHLDMSLSEHSAVSEVVSISHRMDVCLFSAIMFASVCLCVCENLCVFMSLCEMSVYLIVKYLSLFSEMFGCFSVKRLPSFQ